MGEIVIVSENLITYLNNLVFSLYKGGYFSYKSSAQKYVNKIYDAIYYDLPNLTHHPTPQVLKEYGNYYVKIRGSKRTTWYVFFDKHEGLHFVEFITNNHMPESGYFNNL